MNARKVASLEKNDVGSIGGAYHVGPNHQGGLVSRKHVSGHGYRLGGVT